MTKRKVSRSKKHVPAKRATVSRVEKPVPFHPPGSPEAQAATAFQVKREAEMHEEYLHRLSALLTGGLWVDDEQDGLTAEHAICHIAAAQLKALQLAVLQNNVDDQGPDGWCLSDDEMSRADISAVLSGVVATLGLSPEVLRTLRFKGEFRTSLERRRQGEAP